MAKAKKDKEPVTPDDEYREALAEVGLADLVHRVDEFVHMDVECVSTGFPSLDHVLHPNDKDPGEPENVGLPLGRDVEIYSDEPQLGKTAIAEKIIVAFQKAHRKALMVDIEHTVTEEHLIEQGVTLYADQFPDRYPLYLARVDDPSAETMTAEEVLGIVRNSSRVCDLVVVDSIPALIAEDDLNKRVEEGESERTGGVSKMLTVHCRRNVVKKACVLWINQRRETIGGFRRPGMPAKRKSMGGMAVPFFGSIRLELTMKEVIKVGSDDNAEIVGMKVRFYTSKNKIAPWGRSCDLTYINGEGFSVTWDWFEMALKLKIVTKPASSTYYSMGDVSLGQGRMNAYRSLRDNPELLATLQAQVTEKIGNKPEAA